MPSQAAVQDVPNESSSTWYLHHLDSHITSARRHVFGTSTEYERVDVTIVPPSNAFWDPSEKALFFASLRRHSRFRPDLIAAEIPSKSATEVEWYLDLLESGAEVVGQVDRRRVNEGAPRWDGTRSWRAGLAPAAREVSDEWIEKEEELAEGVARLIDKRTEDYQAKINKSSRRKEKLSVVKAITGTDESTPYEKRAYGEESLEVKALKNRWAIEDWSGSLDEGKLSALNRLLKPDWCTWYNDRLREGPGEGEDGDEHDDSDEAGAERKGLPSKGDPRGKIALDYQHFEELSSIPKKERTTEQRRQLAAIVNRRRNRVKYRTNKLVQEGMRLEDIEAAGGADAIFASREGAAEDDVKIRIRTPPGQAGTEGDARMLKDLGMYEHVLMTGLGVFNYDEIGLIAKSLATGKAPEPSFVVLRMIKDELLRFLRPLIHQTILVAEQAYLQSAEDGTQEVTKYHVGQAIAKDTPVHPLRVVEDAIARIFSGADVEPGEEDSEVSEDRDVDAEREESPVAMSSQGVGQAHEPKSNLRRARYPARLLPHSNVPWHLMSVLPLAEDLEQVNHDGPHEEDLEEQGDGIISDHEDGQLEHALHIMDEEHDRRYESALWDVLHKDEQDEGEMDDGGEVWTSRTVRLARGRVVRPRSQVEKEYIQLLFATDSARRKRRVAERQAEMYPTTRLRKRARRDRKEIMPALIVESDDESVMDE
ncbi:hypothetical protein IAU60_006286 [Kwoniella sp. DSM 27419]